MGKGVFLGEPGKATLAGPRGILRHLLYTMPASLDGSLPGHTLLSTTSRVEGVR